MPDAPPQAHHPFFKRSVTHSCMSYNTCTKVAMFCQWNYTTYLFDIIPPVAKFSLIFSDLILRHEPMKPNTIHKTPAELISLFLGVY